MHDDVIKQKERPNRLFKLNLYIQIARRFVYTF